MRRLHRGSEQGILVGPSRARQHLLMTRHVPDPDRPIEGTTLREAADRLAIRVVRDSGGTKLHALADLRAAIEACIVAEARRRSRHLDEAEELLDRTLG